jgi:hypothetical protein
MLKKSAANFLMLMLLAFNVSCFSDDKKDDSDVISFKIQPYMLISFGTAPFTRYYTAISDSSHPVYIENGLTYDSDFDTDITFDLEDPNTFTFKDEDEEEYTLTRTEEAGYIRFTDQNGNYVDTVEITDFSILEGAFNEAWEVERDTVEPKLYKYVKQTFGSETMTFPYLFKFDESDLMYEDDEYYESITRQLNEPGKKRVPWLKRIK